MLIDAPSMRTRSFARDLVPNEPYLSKETQNAHSPHLNTLRPRGFPMWKGEGRGGAGTEVGRPKIASITR